MIVVGERLGPSSGKLQAGGGARGRDQAIKRGGTAGPQYLNSSLHVLIIPKFNLIQYEIL